MMAGVYENALKVLETAKAEDKALKAQILLDHWQHGHEYGSPPVSVPKHPSRPAKPPLVPPSQVPRRRLGSESGRIALLHAIAHIELNAIDLAADMIARFAHSPAIDDADRQAFITDWAIVCADEARHFMLLKNRLQSLGADYGDYPAHDGLWSAALSTQDHLSARLAIAPMVLEARGLDVTPPMIEKLSRTGDHDSVAILQTIYTEEIAHVAYGCKWFAYMAKKQKETPEAYFQNLVRVHFSGQLKPPFNIQARNMAGLYERFYKPLIKNNL